MEQMMKIVELEDKLKQKALQVSQLYQVLNDIKVYLEEDDAEGALKYLNDCIGE